MHVQIIKNTTDWEQFFCTQPFTPFVQSGRYIDFYKHLSEDGFILGIYEKDTIIGGSVVVTTHAKRGSFLYLPYGPLLPAQQTSEALGLFLKFLTDYGREKKFDFIRVSPFLDETLTTKNLFETHGFRSAPMHVLAENTWLLDVTPSEDVLLQNMNKNHRNLIRRCEREGVIIKQTTLPSHLSGLSDLLDITAKRHGFRRFSAEYIEQEFKSYLPDHVVLFESFLPDGTLDGAAVIMFYHTMAAYRHSASLGLNSKLPTSYLLQWRVIQEAKKRGMHWYNFWGIAPEGSSSEHPFFGITHFKKGFGGIKKDLLHCHDYPLTYRYWLNWMVETLRRFKRGF